MLLVIGYLKMTGEFSIKDYGKIIEIILLTIRLYTGVLLTTFATISRLVKNESSSLNKSTSSKYRCPLQGKDIKEYIQEIKGLKNKNNKYSFYEKDKYPTDKYTYLYLDIREKD